jgi:hypothetical protein
MISGQNPNPMTNSCRTESGSTQSLYISSEKHVFQEDSDSTDMTTRSRTHGIRVGRLGRPLKDTRSSEEIRATGDEVGARQARRRESNRQSAARAKIKRQQQNGQLLVLIKELQTQLKVVKSQLASEYEGKLTSTRQLYETQLMQLSIENGRLRALYEDKTRELDDKIKTIEHLLQGVSIKDEWEGFGERVIF